MEREPSSTRAIGTNPAPVVVYGLTVATVVAACAIRWLIDPFLGDHLPFVTFFVAVAVGAWLGGLRAALLATVLGILLADYFFVPPRFVMFYARGPHLVGLIMYLMVSLAFAWFGEAMHSSRRRIAEQREWLRATLASIGDGVISTDAAGRISHMNRVAEALTGWTSREAVGLPLETVFRIVNEETRLTVESPAMKALHDGVIVGLANHTLLIAKDGTERPIDDSAAPIRTERGHIEGCVLVFRDITLRREVEAKEKAANDRAISTLAVLNSLVSSAPLGITVLDRDMRYQLINEPLAEMNGVPAVEHIGKKVSDIIPQMVHLVEPLFRKVLETGLCIPDQIIERETAKAPGVKRTWRESWFPMSGQDGRPSGVGVIVEEITEQRRIEERLRFQLQLTQSITDNATTAIFMMDADGYCTFMNPAAERMSGFIFGETQGRVLHDLVHHHHPDGRPFPYSECPIDRALPEDREVVDHEETFIRKNGEFYPVLVNAKPIRRDGVAIGTVIEVRDITEQKRLYDSLRDADRRKDEFLATLAHELRNPLAPIRNAVYILRAIGSHDAKTRQVQEMIERQVTHMVRLVDDLLEVSRITRGKIELHKERIDLSQVVKNAVETSSLFIEAGGHELTLALPSESIEMEGDMVRLTQVVTNLLNNAAKYTPSGGQIWVTVERDGDQGVIQVRDNGPGIPPEMLTSVFELFTQVKGDQHRAQGGLGIGLALAKRLVEMHGGRIEARNNEQDQGVVFLIHLPLLSPVRTQPPSSAQDQQSTGCNPCRVLIVDDNVDAAESLSLYLKLQNHEVAVAHDGPGGIEQALAFRPDVILLDLGMPGMDGLETARRLRALPELERVKVVALTGWGQEEDRRRTREAGFDGHLVKPVEPTALQEWLNTAGRR